MWMYELRVCLSTIANKQRLLGKWMHKCMCTYMICCLVTLQWWRQMSMTANIHNSIETKRNPYRSVQNANFLFSMFEINIYLYIIHNLTCVWRDKSQLIVHPDCFLHNDSVPNVYPFTFWIPKIKTFNIQVISHVHTHTKQLTDTSRVNSSLIMEGTADCSLPSLITCHMTCADNCKALQVLWLNTRAASASDTPSRWPPPGPRWRCSSPGIWILLEPFKHRQAVEREDQVGGLKRAHSSVDWDLPPRCMMPFPSRVASPPG